MSESAVGDKLAEEFPPAMLKSMSKGGTSLTYVPVAEVIARLNGVLGYDGWSYEIIDRWASGERQTDSGTYPAWCMAHVRLTLDGVSHDGIGGVAVKFTQNNAGPVDIGDEWKGCVSDALKKAAQAFGVGLDIARKEDALKAEQTERYATAAKTGGWESFVDHDTRLGSLHARAKALGDESRAKLRAWWDEQKFSMPVTVDQADSYEQQIAEHEDHAERPFDETSRSDAA